MSHGPGKYDELCGMVRALSGAQAVVLIIGEGIHGDGFEVQTASESPEHTRAFVENLIDIMRTSADGMAADLAALDAKIKAGG